MPSITFCYVNAPKGWKQDKEGEVSITGCVILDMDVFLRALDNPEEFRNLVTLCQAGQKPDGSSLPETRE